uniref:C2H2-type domain-containing protein n=1 Tax=Panagrellus redivivus TaxID=6233 RepID=A0A7E5A119_PANRE
MKQLYLYLAANVPFFRHEIRESASRLSVSGGAETLATFTQGWLGSTLTQLSDPGRRTNPFPFEAADGCLGCAHAHCKHELVERRHPTTHTYTLAPSLLPLRADWALAREFSLLLHNSCIPSHKSVLCASHIPDARAEASNPCLPRFADGRTQHEWQLPQFAGPLTNLYTQPTPGTPRRASPSLAFGLDSATVFVHQVLATVFDSSSFCFRFTFGPVCALSRLQYWDRLSCLLFCTFFPRLR